MFIWCELVLGMDLSTTQQHMIAVVETAMVCAGAALIPVAFLLAISVLGAIGMRRKERATRQEEPILIEESPMPTRSFKTFTTPASRAASSRRAGAVRLPAHRRASTRKYNPSKPGDCGYECALVAAGIRPSRTKIATLRLAVSKRIHAAFINDQEIGNIRVRDLVQKEHLIIAAYAAQTAHLMWASPCEVMAAAQELETDLAVQVGKKVKFSVGSNPKWVVKLKGQHFTLHKIHTKAKYGTGASGLKDSHSRGGMQQQPASSSAPPQTSLLQTSPAAVARSQQHGIILHINPVQRVHPLQRVSVAIEGQVDPTILSAQLQCAEHPTMWGLKKILGRVLAVPPARIRIFSPDDPRRLEPFPDWLTPEGEVIAVIMPDMEEDTPEIPSHMNEIEVSMLGTHVCFRTQVHSLADHRELKRMIAEHLSLRVEDFTILDIYGHEWTYPQDMQRSSSVVVCPRRGGMRPTDITPTEPFQDVDMQQGAQDSQPPFPVVDQWPHQALPPQQEQDPEVQQQQHQGDQRRGRGASSRSRSRSPTPMTFRCLTLPRHPDDLQPEIHQVPIMNRGRRFAMLHGYADALASSS